jgi:hypothetical protein
LTEELTKKAEELITSLIGEFNREMQRSKGQIVSNLIESIEIMASNNSAAQNIVFQINIRSDNNAER